MRFILMALLAGALALGQNPNTAKFPTSVATDTDLPPASNRFRTTLASGINDSTLSVTLTSASTLTVPGIITIGACTGVGDCEHVHVCSKDGNDLTVCASGRGFSGSTAATFSAGAAVSGNLVPYHINQVNAELKAIEARLADLQSTYLSDYAVARTSGTILTISPGRVRFGNNTQTTLIATATISAGTGTAYIYVANGGQLTVADDLTVSCGGGASCTSGTAFPVDSIPVAIWTATDGVWDVSGGTDQRAFLSTKKVSNGTGIVLTEASGNAEIAVDTSVVPTFGSAAMVRAVGYAFDGGGSALTTGNSPAITVPFACTIVAWNATVDAGTITFKVWKAATGTAVPTVSDVINTSGVGISTGTAIHSTTLTDFSTTAVAANDIVIVAITAVSSATKASFVLGCRQ